MISGRCNILSTIRYVSEFSKNRYGVTCSKVISLNEGLMFSGRHVSRFERLSSLLISSRMASSSANDSTLDHEDSTTKGRNRLALEKSPYLLQHATNPVQWYPWGEEAFAKARQEDKVIFLSVGYSTCHWCHVMERESFEDSETAEIMNKFFVNIKVDREERPDVDQMYMTFIQNISGHGGWPMSVFLTPDLKPITGGTYFPPDDKYGQPSFKRVLLSVAKKWKENKSDVSTFSTKYIESLQRSIDSKNREEARTVPQLNCARICLRQLEKYYESEYGGFSEAPKFPQPVNLNFLFHMYAREPNGEFGPNCLEMCEFTLRKMANGGIHDHVGQGFARYSVDGKWHVPHFEKMLYDQGQLIQSYADAFVATKDPFFAEIIDDIATYVTRDLRHKEGGFYSAEDADSLPTVDATAKQEGAFYVWTYDEIQSLLNENLTGSENFKLYQIFCHHYNVKKNGNVAQSQDPHGELTGKNVLFVHGSIEETAEKFRLTASDVKKYLKEACQILFEARSSRPRPHLDDKIITAWNGLMISGLSRAGAAMSDKRYIEYASEAAKFVEKYLYDETNKLLYRSCYRTDGDLIVHTSVKIQGFHCDYAFLVKGLLDLYEASFNAHWLEFAEELQNTQDKLFWDAKNGGYFSTTKDDPTILLRFKNDHDGAEPSGNSVACSNLLRLAAYLDRDEFKQKAEAIFLSFQSTLTRSPILVPEMVSALLDYHDTMTQIYIAGKPEAEDTKALIRVVRERLVPGRVVLLADHEQQDNILFRKSNVAGKMKPLNGLATAYVCRHHTCSLPVTNPNELATLLTEDEK